MPNRTVLVVDDEPDVRAMMAQMLAEDEFEVLQAQDGAEALRIAGSTRIDLLIADVAMPAMSGPELIVHLKDRGYSGLCLLISGYSGDSLDQVHGIADRVPFLPKPFTAVRFLGKVHELLGTGVGSAGAF